VPLIKLIKYFIYRYSHIATVFDDYRLTWDKALLKSSGYQNQSILNKVLESTSYSIKDNSMIERDSVLIEKDSVEYSYPLLFAFQLSLIENKDTLRIIDYGGALGSTYFQYKPFFPPDTKIEWSIIEQSNFVEAGIKLNPHKDIYFYENLSQCLQNRNPSLALFSSSLQYLKNPFDILNQISESSVQTLVIDRVPIFVNDSSCLSVQYVPDWIYNSRISYPSHIFNLKEISNFLKDKWNLISEFRSLGSDSITSTGKTVQWGGAVYVRK
jgi:putative methyltransferase (TIGR04325 family)